MSQLANHLPYVLIMLILAYSLVSYVDHAYPRVSFSVATQLHSVTLLASPTQSGEHMAPQCLDS